jgi:hypothetical protein
MGKRGWFLAVFLGLVLGFAAPVKASEGVVELENVLGEPGRCFAASVLMTNYQYTVIMSCRDLVYPVDSNVFKYSVWVVPLSGKKPYKVTPDLGVGKLQFVVKEAFSGLYVTRPGPGFGSKEEIVVMRGNVAQIAFLNTGEQGQIGPSITPVPAAAAQGNTPSTATKIASSLNIGSLVGKIVGVMLVLGVIGLSVVIVVSSWGGRRKNPPEI